MKNKFFASILIFWVSIFFCDSIFSQTATIEQVKELLEVMSAEEQFISSMETMVEFQKQSGQADLVPKDFFEEFIKEAKAEFKTELMPQLEEIYRKNFTSKEVEELIALYKTEIGKMLLTKMPLVQSELATAGMQWGQELGIKVAQKLMSKE